MSPENPSRTACKVALNILTLGAKPEMVIILPSGILDATQRLLLASGAARERTVRWSRTSKMVLVYKAFEWMMPGQFEAFAHRKRFFEDQVRQAIASGTSQVLVLGGGYDTLGWRLAAEYPDADFFEIDHPDTALLKAKGIQKMGVRSNLHLIAEDLGTYNLADLLFSDKTWERNKPTIILAEGLLQYLQPEAVEDLFERCASVAKESTIVFTYIASCDDGKPNAGPSSGLVLWMLKIGGEPWLWSTRPEELGSFLEKRGWRYIPELFGNTVGHGIELYGAATKGK